MPKLDAIYSLKGKRVWVAGHRGMVGSALLRQLQHEDCELVTVSRQQVDLRRQHDVEHWMETTRPEVVFVPAARVGGILANATYPADFIYDNLMIEANIIHAAWQTGVEKLLFLGSSCIYPKSAPQPMTEDVLLTGELEPTNEWYAIAKIAGIKLCQAYRKQHGCDFISAMPTNLYGPGDNYDLENSHVLPAMMRKIHDAHIAGQDSVVIWGTGTPKREFLHVDDLANALIFLIKNYSDPKTINVGSGDEVMIRELADIIAEAVGYKGKFEHDTSKPDGVPRKLLDISRLASLGWQPSTSLGQGVEQTFNWYLSKLKDEKADIRL